MTKTKLYQIIGSKPCARHICGDGAEMLRFNCVINDTYQALCAAYEEEGYALYCEDPRQGGFLPESRTYTKGDDGHFYVSVTAKAESWIGNTDDILKIFNTYVK